MSSIFKYQLPSGAQFTMTAPDGTTQDEADKIFYGQVAAGTFAGYSAGQTLTAATANLTKFELSRLDRGTAGVDEIPVLAVIGGVTISTTVPDLLDVPVVNPVTQAGFVATASGLGASAIGPLTSPQVRSLMAQAAAQVGQDFDVITQELGLGKYGFNSMQLEMAGYLKPGTTAQFLNANQSVAAPNPDNFVDVLSSPTVWTGINGIDGVNALLLSEAQQDAIQQLLLAYSYECLTNAGIIQTSSAPGASLMTGVVYSATGELTSASSVGRLITNNTNNAGLAAQIAQALHTSGVNTSTASLLNAAGLGGATGAVVGLAGTASALAKSIGGISLTNPSSITSALGAAKTATALVQQNVGSLLAVGSKFGTQAAAVWAGGLSGLQDKAAGVLNSAITNVKGQVTGIISGVEAQGKAILAQGQALYNQVGKMGKYAIDFANGKLDSLTSGFKQAAAFSGTINRTTVDVATTKIIGNAKVPSPDFSSVSALNASVQADIQYAQNALNTAQTQVASVMAQGQAIAGQVQGTVAAGQQIFNQGAGLAQNVQATATGLPNKIIGSAGRLI